MPTKPIEQYYKEEIATLSAMLHKYNEYGYSPELRPLVRVLEFAKNELNDNLTLITNQKRIS